jgi:hypothetical protein
MRASLWRHHVNLAAIEFLAASLFLGPGKELIDSHERFQRGLHGTKLASVGQPINTLGVQA